MPSPNRFASVCFIVAVALCASLSFAQYSINTIAGGGPNGVTAVNASAGYPEGIAFDSGGNAYIADSYANQILKVSGSGTVTVVAGNGTTGYSGDGGPATGAALNLPLGIFLDSAGDIFIADSGNALIREVIASTGVIQTVAGNFTAGPGYSGDGGSATQAQLDTPSGIFVDGSGNIFIADTGNSLIREVILSSGDIQTVVGTPGAPGYVDGVLATNAQLAGPQGVFLDTAGNIFVADSLNNVVRVVNTSAQPITIDGSPSIQPGYVQTVVGTQYAYTGSCSASPATNLCLPTGIFVDGSENIYIADNNNLAIREFSASGALSTVAGTIGSECTTYRTTGCGNGASATAVTAQLNYPNGVFVDSSGDIYIADSEDFVVREVVASSGNIQAFAGNGFEAYSGDGGSPTNAELNNPGGVFVDGAGNVYIADTSNSVIRFINNTSSAYTVPGTTAVIQPGDVGTVAGNGAPGYSGDGGLATTAQLNFPQGVFVDSAGNIFISDSGNNVIRKVIASSGNIQTIVGNGVQCTNQSTTKCGDGGAPLSAQLDNPLAVAVDVSGNIFIADTDDDAIRVVNVSTSAALTFGPSISVPPSAILTVAGTLNLDCNSSQAPANCGDGAVANAAYLFQPAGVTIDAHDNIFIADTFNHAIRQVSSTTGIVQTVAGTIKTSGFSGDGALATSAELDSPQGVFVDSANDIFIADSDNAAIREVVAATSFIQTVAGIPATTDGFPTPGFSGDGGPATSAELNFPSGVFANSAGKVFIPDTDNSRIRELTAAPFSVTVAPSTATVVINALQQYTATVTGNSNTAVNWFVNGVAGGNSTVGTISTSGLFQAPAAVPSPATVTISAVSQADNATSGTAQATIANPSTTDTITVSPTPVQVYAGALQAFSASDNGTATTAVNWYVEGTQGGNTTFGTIDTSGSYTAPAAVPSPATITVEAVLQADATAIGTASVTIVAAPSSPQPAAQTVSPGGTATYTLSITGSAGPMLTLACLQSTLPSGATCSFSPATITPSSTAQSVTLTVNVPSTSASLPKSEQRSLWPQVYVGFIPLTAILLLGAVPRKRRARLLGLGLAVICLLAMFACGGGSSSKTGPTTYTIQVQGKAQAQVVNITTASLTVQ